MSGINTSTNEPSIVEQEKRAEEHLRKTMRNRLGVQISPETEQMLMGDIRRDAGKVDQNISRDYLVFYMVTRNDLYTGIRILEWILGTNNSAMYSEIARYGRNIPFYKMLEEIHKLFQKKLEEPESEEEKSVSSDPDDKGKKPIDYFSIKALKDIIEYLIDSHDEDSSVFGEYIKIMSQYKETLENLESYC